MDGENVGRGRRRQLALLLAGELHALIPRGIRLDSVMIEDHREDGDCLPDRLLPESRVREFRDEARDVREGVRSETAISPKRGRSRPCATR